MDPLSTIQCVGGILQVTAKIVERCMYYRTRYLQTSELLQDITDETSLLQVVLNTIEEQFSGLAGQQDSTNHGYQLARVVLSHLTRRSAILFTIENELGAIEPWAKDGNLIHISPKERLLFSLNQKLLNLLVKLRDLYPRLQFVMNVLQVKSNRRTPYSLKADGLVHLPRSRVTQAFQELGPTAPNFSWPSTHRKSILSTRPRHFSVLEDVEEESSECEMHAEAEQPTLEFTEQVMEDKETSSDSSDIRQVLVNTFWTAPDRAVTPPLSKRSKSTTRERAYSQRSPRRSPLSDKSTNRVSKPRYGKRPNTPRINQGRASQDPEAAQVISAIFMLVDSDSGLEALHVGEQDSSIGMAI